MRRPSPSGGRLARVQSPSEPPDRAAESGTNGGREAVQRWRLVLRRDTLAGASGQREQLAEWEASLAASGLPIAGLDAPKPKLRVVTAAPLSAGTPGEAELADVFLVERLPGWRVREALVAALPAAYTLMDLFDVWLGESPLPGRVAASVYRAVVRPPVGIDRVAAGAQGLLAAQALPRERRKGESTVSYDLRPFLAALDVEAGPDGVAVIRMTLRHDPAKGVGRPDETLAALAEASGEGLEAASLVRERLVLAEPAPPEPAPPRGPRRLPPVRSGSDPRHRPPRAGGH